MIEKQYEKCLRLLRLKPQTTMDFVAQYILAPQKCIEMLRDKGYDIETQKIEGKKEKLYVLHEIDQVTRLVSNQVTEQVKLLNIMPDIPEHTKWA